MFILLPPHNIKATGKPAACLHKWESIDGEFIVLELQYVSWTDFDLHIVKFSYSCEELFVGKVAAVAYQSGVFHQLLRQMVHHRLTWELLAHPDSSSTYKTAVAEGSFSSAEPGGEINKSLSLKNVFVYMTVYLRHIDESQSINKNVVREACCFSRGYCVWIAFLYIVFHMLYLIMFWFCAAATLARSFL